MTLFRDWPSTLRRASYRGVPFHVDKDTIDGEGRRLVVHEFPLGEAPYVEDNGRDTTKIKVTAYLVSDDADSHEKALRRACSARGPGSLSLPLERMLAHCETCKRDYTKDKLGYIAFDLSFVREGASSSPISLLGLGANLAALAGGLLLAGSVLFSAFAALYRGLGVASFVLRSAAGTVQDAAAAMDAARAGMILEAGRGAGIVRLTQTLYDDAEDLAACGARGDAWTRTSFRSISADVDPAPLVAALVAPVAALREASTPEIAIPALAQLAAFGLDLDPVPLSTLSRRIEARNRDALATVVRVAALTQWVEALVLATFTDRRAAIQARADIAEAIDAELDRLSALGPETQPLWTTLYDLQGRAVDMLSRTIADLAPVLTVTSPQPMPALWWANRLYGDAARAGELVDRNRVRHPLFMPTEIEALAR